jgi:hypothetical protein
VHRVSAGAARSARLRLADGRLRHGWSERVRRTCPESTNHRLCAVGTIWTEIEAGFDIELETAVRIDVLPDQRHDGAQITRLATREKGSRGSQR